MLTTKPGVRFAIITPALLYMLTTVERLSRTLSGVPAEGLVITSGSDGTHMAGSKHYTGEAIDVRSKTFGRPALGVFIATLRSQLGPQFTVLLEDNGAANEHLHVQVKKGRLFDPEADIEDKNAAAIAAALKERGKRHEASKVLDLRNIARNSRRQSGRRANRITARRDQFDDGAGAVEHAGG